MAEYLDTRYVKVIGLCLGADSVNRDPVIKTVESTSRKGAAMSQARVWILAMAMGGALVVGGCKDDTKSTTGGTGSGATGAGATGAPAGRSRVTPDSMPSDSTAPTTGQSTGTTGDTSEKKTSTDSKDTQDKSTPDSSK
jgi:hypothetical protein